MWKHRQTLQGVCNYKLTIVHMVRLSTIKTMQHIIKRKSGNVQIIDARIKSTRDNVRMLALSDLHFDNPKCNRDLLKRHLDQAVQNDAFICIFGDLFCAMEGFGDPRASKAIRPEHMPAAGGAYLDLIVHEAVEWFKPYGKNLFLVCPGNHETSVLKRHEINLIDRFCAMMRANGACTIAGGHGNFCKIRTDYQNTKTQTTIYSHHGYGGSGAWGRQTNAFQKYLTQCTADIYIAGHIHRKETFPLVQAYLDTKNKVKQRKIHFIRTGTYKDEFKDGAHGWANEKAMGARPMGGYWLEWYNTNKMWHRRIYETDC